MASRSRALVLADLIDRFMREQELGRTTGASLEAIRKRIGGAPADSLTSDFFVDYARSRECKPATWSAELSQLSAVLRAARIHWQVPVSADSVTDARSILHEHGFETASTTRTRRPTPTELQRLIDYFAENPRQRIPMHQIIPIAATTALDAAEIMTVRWADWDRRGKTLKTSGRIIPLLQDATQILESMPVGKDRIFPFRPTTISTIFPRACQALKIRDLRFRDLRHEATIRYLEAGYSIHNVAVITGRRDLNSMRRYVTPLTS